MEILREFNEPSTLLFDPCSESENPSVASEVLKNFFTKCVNGV